MKLSAQQKTLALEVSLACIIVTYLILNPAHASLAEMGDKVDKASKDLLVILKATAGLGLIGGCLVWSTGNDNGKEWGKKAVIACSIGLSTFTIIDGLAAIFA